MHAWRFASSSVCALLVLAAPACALFGGDECSADADCYADNVCHRGDCVECESDVDCDGDDVCDDNECEPAEGEGEGEQAGDGEGEGEGEEPDTDATVAAACARLAECDATSAATCLTELDAQLDAADAASATSSLCADVHASLLAVADCIGSTACEAMDIDCIEVDEAHRQLLDAGGAACLPAGAAVPAAWVCPSDDYGDGECDCGCGALDLDCGIGRACASPGCTAVGCDFCYASADDAVLGEGDECGVP